MTDAKPKILLVDDEPQVLAGLSRGLRQGFEVHTATSGDLGLEVLARERGVAIVMSDMRMPVMNGTAFLARVRATTPDAVRLLLTGHADMDDAIGAINLGNIFRFLRKPCPPDVLRSALADALVQHRLITAERELLEQTLHGAVKALCDTLALANPEIFGTGTRVKRIASGLAQKIGGAEIWQVEVAALLSQLGAITLPPGVYQRRTLTAQLSPEEREMLAKVPQITDRLLAPIPRLERVRAIVLRACSPGTPPVAAEGETKRASDILRVALDFEELESAGAPPKGAIEELSRRTGRYDGAILRTLAELYVDGPQKTLAIPIAGLLDGMIVAEDVLTKTGTLLVARGYEVTPGLVRRLENFAGSLSSDTIAVVVDDSGHPARTVRGPRSISLP